MFSFFTLIVLLSSTPAAPGITLDAAETHVRDAWGKVHALRAEIASKSLLHVGPDRVESANTGTLEYLKDGPREKYRIAVRLKGGLGEKLTKRPIETLCDGLNLYRISHVAGKPLVQQVEGNLLEQNTPPGGAKLIGLLHAQCELNSVCEEQLDGTPVFVFEGVPKSEGSANKGVAKIRVYVDKALGLQRKAVFYNDGGEETSSVTLSSVTLNPELSKELFATPAK